MNKCKSCNTEMELISTSADSTVEYCRTCDVTFTITKGKQSVAVPEEGRLKKIEEGLAYLQKDFGDHCKSPKEKAHPLDELLGLDREDPQ